MEGQRENREKKLWHFLKQVRGQPLTARGVQILNVLVEPGSAGERAKLTALLASSARLQELLAAEEFAAAAAEARVANVSPSDAPLVQKAILIRLKERFGVSNLKGLIEDMIAAESKSRHVGG